MNSSRTATFILRILVVCFCFICTSAHSHSHHADDHHHHHEHEHEHDQNPSFKYSKAANEPLQTSHSSVPPETPRDTANLWVEALGSTLLISAAPFIILFFIPIDDREKHEPLLKILLSFASGGLLGDAFLHLIPHALLASDESGNSHAHSHSHGGHSEVHGHDLSVGLGVLGGIVVFLMLEKLVRILKGGHSHSHSHESPAEEVANKMPAREKEDKPEKLRHRKKKDEREREDENEKADEREREDEEEENDQELPDDKEEDDHDKIMVGGYLNLVADFMHNFTDGLAIGASYIAGSGVGLITTFTILLHEVPHEIGDFAILIQSGCSKRKAILLQLVTALGAIAGTVCSLLAQGMDIWITKFILPFTAGGFIYIATVSVIPELLEDSKFWQSVKEILALLVGVAMMVVIAQYE